MHFNAFQLNIAKNAQVGEIYIRTDIHRFLLSSITHKLLSNALYVLKLNQYISQIKFFREKNVIYIERSSELVRMYNYI